MLLIMSPMVHSVFAHIRKSVGMGVLRLKMKAASLTNTEGFMRKPDPFFELSRRIDSAGGATWCVLSFSRSCILLLVAMNLIILVKGQCVSIQCSQGQLESSMAGYYCGTESVVWR